ncbi:MAG: hypothetical protein OXG47_02470 [bacterium]|nr:hypothetical protein [bacterium]MCY3926232.1 hypothetical protein [bacterium]
MAQPPYVPHAPGGAAPHYTSPPQRRGGWRAGRPGELAEGPQPAGDGFGHQGPDQGYALRLAKRFVPRLALQPGEKAADVVAGCVTVAIKRASLFGRAPVAADLQTAFDHWGYLDAGTPVEVVASRRALFAGAGGHDGYTVRSRIAEEVPPEALGAP